jgi:hypothetical protein
MSNINDGLVLHLKLDKIEENGTVIDHSISPRTKITKGKNTKLVKDDKFGTCFNFNGTADDYVKVSMHEKLYRLPTITISVWVFIAEEPKDLVSIINTNFKEATYGIKIRYNQQKSNYELLFSIPLYSRNPNEVLTITENLNKNNWYHFTGVFQDNEPLGFYINGIKKNTRADNYDFERYATYEASITIGNFGAIHPPQEIPPYNIRIANVRIYKRPLSAEEIIQVMEADLKLPVIEIIEIEEADLKPPVIAPDPITPPLYRKGHPIDFSLLDKDNNYVLYISDDPSTEHILNLELKNSSTQAIQFLKGSGKNASQDNYHFELVFRLDTLSKTTISLLRGDDKAKVLKNPEEWDVAISPEHSKKQTQTVSLYFRYKGKEIKFEPTTTRSIALQNISAAAGSGARGTQVELKLHQLAYVDDAHPHKTPSPITGSRVQKLHIANHVGRKNVPLHVGFVGSNRILNDGSSASKLDLRITNTSKEAISLEGGRFILSFDVGSEDWAIATNDRLKQFNIKVNNKEIQNPGGGQNVSPEWIIENLSIDNLKSKEFIEISISNIITERPSGYTNLYIKYENILGYWDGQFVCAIEKAPLLFYSNNVGIGVIKPKNKLDVAGGVVIGANYSGQQTAFENSLLVEGNVGIGVIKPEAKLHISGDLTLTAGHATFEDTTVRKLTIGSTEISGEELEQLKKYADHQIEQNKIIEQQKKHEKQIQQMQAALSSLGHPGIPEFSDIRVKTNSTLVNSREALNTIMKLNIYEFGYNEAFSSVYGTVHKAKGFMAHEVEKHIPIAVSNRGTYKLDNDVTIEDLKAVNYNTIFSEAVAALQELNKITQAQSSEIEAMKQQIADLKLENKLMKQKTDKTTSQAKEFNSTSVES